MHLVNSIFANDDVINIISPTYSRKKKRKFLRVVSRSLQDETATAQVETKDCCVNCKVSTCVSNETKVRQTLLLESTPEEGLLNVSTEGNRFETVAKQDIS